MGGQYSFLSNTQKPVDMPRYNAFIQEERYPSLPAFTGKLQDDNRTSPEQKSNSIIAGYLHFPAQKQR